MSTPRRWIQRPWTRWLLVLALLPAAPLAADEAAPDLDAFAQRLAEPGGLWLTLWEVGEAGPAAAPLVPAVAQHLARGHEVTRRLAAEALGKIGPGSPAAVAALLEALPRARGLLEDAVLRALVALDVGVPLRGALPEAITYASTPCLCALERAYAQKIVRADELAWLEACRLEADAHASRMTADRVFRLGEQLAANVAAGLADRPEVAFATRWSAPFLIVACVPRAATPDAPALHAPAIRPAVARDPEVEARLDDAARVCGAVYRNVLARSGPDHGLQPLEDAWGGRADLPPARRSFADGCPVQVWLIERSLLGGGRSDRWRRPPDGVEAFHDANLDGTVVVTDAGERPSPRVVAWAAADALLHAFGRQQRAWRHAKRSGVEGWLPEAVRALWGAPEPVPPGATLGVSTVPSLARWIDVLRGWASGRGGTRGLAALQMPLARMLACQRPVDALSWAAEVGLDPRVGALVLRAQATGFALYLAHHAEPPRRAQLTALIGHLLADDLGPEEARRVLLLRDEDDVEALDAEFRAWWLAQLEPPQAPPPPAPPAPPAPPERPDTPR